MAVGAVLKGSALLDVLALLVCAAPASVSCAKHADAAAVVLVLVVVLLLRCVGGCVDGDMLCAHHIAEVCTGIERGVVESIILKRNLYIFLDVWGGRLCGWRHVRCTQS